MYYTVDIPFYSGLPFKHVMANLFVFIDLIKVNGVLNSSDFNCKMSKTIFESYCGRSKFRADWAKRTVYKAA